MWDLLGSDCAYQAITASLALVEMGYLGGLRWGGSQGRRVEVWV